MSKKAILLLGLSVLIILTACAQETPVSTPTEEATEIVVSENSEDAVISEPETESTQDITGMNVEARDAIPAAAVWEEYGTDIERLNMHSDWEIESECIDRGDYYEITNINIRAEVYFEKSDIENAEVGDTISIQGGEYRFDSIEPAADGVGYLVSMTCVDDTDDIVYSDIYLFGIAPDGEHYIAEYCSADIIDELVYSGSVYIAKDAIVHTWIEDATGDCTMEEFYQNAEYFSIHAISFSIDDNGIVNEIWDQISG